MEERMPERRWERRLLCADLIQIEWTDGGGEARKATAVLEDIARSGACLQTDVPVPVETVVKLRHGSKTLEGRVRYCDFREIGYFTGLMFEPAQHWSTRFFRPKHLTDPAELKEWLNAKG
jgi:hypothetical protein